MQKLTAKSVAQKCLKKWDKLGCNTGKTNCLYLYEDGSVCAIGAALTERNLRKAKAYGSVYDLMSSGIVTVDDKEIDTVYYLQKAHDNACTAFTYEKEGLVKQLRERIELIAGDKE